MAELGGKHCCSPKLNRTRQTDKYRNVFGRSCLMYEILLPLILMLSALVQFLCIQFRNEAHSFGFLWNNESRGFSLKWVTPKHVHFEFTLNCPDVPAFSARLSDWRISQHVFINQNINFIVSKIILTLCCIVGHVWYLANDLWPIIYVNVNTDMLPGLIPPLVSEISDYIMRNNRNRWVPVNRTSISP